MSNLKNQVKASSRQPIRKLSTLDVAGPTQDKAVKSEGIISNQLRRAYTAVDSIEGTLASLQNRVNALENNLGLDPTDIVSQDQPAEGPHFANLNDRLESIQRNLHNVEGRLYEILG